MVTNVINLSLVILPFSKTKERLNFVSNNHLFDSIFGLVHCDTWRRYHIPTYAGHKYLLILVDDCSRFTWVYILKQKSYAELLIPKFFSLVENQFHNKIKKFRFDNAQELKFVDFIASKRVTHQFSCVERPEHNSVVERKHQHLVNVARALFFQSQVPKQFWVNVCSQPRFLSIDHPLLFYTIKLIFPCFTIRMWITKILRVIGY